jgi:hypothetical protein
MIAAHLRGRHRASSQPLSHIGLVAYVRIVFWLGVFRVAALVNSKLPIMPFQNQASLERDATKSRSSSRSKPAAAKSVSAKSVKQLRTREGVVDKLVNQMTQMFSSDALIFASELLSRKQPFEAMAALMSDSHNQYSQGSLGYSPSLSGARDTDHVVAEPTFDLLVEQSYALTEAASLLGISRQAVESKVKSKQLIGVLPQSRQRGLRLPKWQFDKTMSDGVVPSVLAIISHRSGWGAWDFFTDSDARLYGLSPLDVLRQVVPPGDFPDEAKALCAKGRAVRVRKVLELAELVRGEET